MKHGRKTIKSVGEFGLIDQIKKWIPPVNRSVVQGIGDDAAVFPVLGGRYQLLTIDTLVEGVDFKRSRATPQQIGWKALAINLSDIAAMGGIPKVALVSLTLPPSTPVQFVKGFYQGMSKLASQFHVSIVGGDLSRGTKISSTVAVLGEVRRHRAILRKRARIGDFICVTGKLGGSILGKHLNFMPRLKEGQFLAQHGASAMIDISDGLVQDLNHLTEGSGLTFMISEPEIPIAQAALKLARGNKKRALRHALSDGEDFELLFTIAPARLCVVEKGWSDHFRVPLTVIGRVVRGEEKSRRRMGFQHF